MLTWLLVLVLACVCHGEQDTLAAPEMAHTLQLVEGKEPGDLQELVRISNGARKPAAPRCLHSLPRQQRQAAGAA